MTSNDAGAGRRTLLPFLAVPLIVIALVGIVGTTAATSGGGGADTAAPAGGAGAGAVAIQAFAFEPGEVTVPAGTEVVWTNNDAAVHTVADQSDAFPESDDLAKGDTFSFVYAEPGTYAYFCGVHNYMTGTVVVSG